MKKIILLLFFYTLIVRTGEIEHQFDLANQHYRNSEFGKAAEIYENILNNGFHSPELYYNLGNVYFKLDNIAAAILYYERAKLLSPSDEDINFNLKIANLKVVDKIETIPKVFFIEWWYNLTNVNNSSEWSKFSIIFLWTVLLSFVILKIVKSIALRKLTFILGIIFLFMSFLTLGFAYTQYKNENSKASAIIFAQNVTIKSSPDISGKDLFILHEGVKVEILDSVENWKKIKLADGKIGWIPGDALRII